MPVKSCIHGGRSLGIWPGAHQAGLEGPGLDRQIQLESAWFSEVTRLHKEPTGAQASFSGHDHLQRRAMTIARYLCLRGH